MMMMIRLYIKYGHQPTILFGCTQTKKSHQHQTSDIVSPESHIEAVMKLGETDEPFQHLNFHDGWWKIMIIEETRLWLA